MYNTKIIRLVSKLFSFIFIFSILVSSNVYALEANNTLSLEAIFNDAEQSYQVSPASNSSNTLSQDIIYETQIISDELTLNVIGYPTTYSACDDELLPGQQSENYIIAFRSSLLTNQNETTQTWGYMLSTLKFYQRDITESGIVHHQRRIDSFSYVIEPANGYSFSSMSIDYYSENWHFPEEDVFKTITSNQLTMTNYPTTSLGWVCYSDTGITGGTMTTAVRYNPTFNGRTYFFGHALIVDGNS